MMYDNIYLDTPTMGLFFPYGDFGVKSFSPQSSSTSDFYPLENYISYSSSPTFPSSPAQEAWIPGFSFVYLQGK